MCGAVDITDLEWSVIAPLLPDKVRGMKRADDRRVLSGILWRLRTGAPWAAIPARYGPHTTCVNRFFRWRRAGVWDRLVQAALAVHGGAAEPVDAAAAGLGRRHRRSDRPEPVAWIARRRDGAAGSPAAT